MKKGQSTTGFLPVVPGGYQSGKPKWVFVTQPDFTKSDRRHCHIANQSGSELTSEGYSCIRTPLDHRGQVSA